MLAIMYVNSIFLYKQKLTDRVSLMLSFALAMSLSEIGWVICEGNANLCMITYISTMLQRRDQSCEEIHKNHGLFLGGMEFTRYKLAELHLEPGDRLLLFTDGVVEAHDKGKNLYGNERLQKVLDDARDCPGEQVLERILNDVNEFATRVPQFDDITMVILTIK